MVLFEASIFQQALGMSRACSCQVTYCDTWILDRPSQEFCGLHYISGCQPSHRPNPVGRSVAGAPRESYL